MFWSEAFLQKMNCVFQTRLCGTLAERHKFRSHWNSLGDLHANYRFERFQFAGVRNGEPQEQLFQRILLADILDGSLRTDGGGACQNQHRMCRIQSSLERYDGIVFRQGLLRPRRKKLLRFARFRMKIDDLHGARPRPGSDLFEGEFLSVW